MANRYFRFKLGRLARRLYRRFNRTFYVDRHPELNRSVLIAGVARSGTTWLADLIAAQIRARILFEPFHPIKVEAYRAFNYYQYMRPQDGNPDLRAYAERIFSGDIRNPWIDRQVETLRPEFRIVKTVRTNLMFKWLGQQFPEVPKCLILRHPCATYVSWRSLGWDPDFDLDLLLDHQPELMQDFLSDRLDVLKSYVTPEEKFAAFWCIQNLVPLRHYDGNAIPLVFYENLCIRPGEEIARAFSLLKIDFHEDVLSSAERPSTTTRHNSAVLTGEDRIRAWQKKLTRTERNRILDVVTYFELDHVYTDVLLPSDGMNG